MRFAFIVDPLDKLKAFGPGRMFCSGLEGGKTTGNFRRLVFAFGREPLPDRPLLGLPHQPAMATQLGRTQSELGDTAIHDRRRGSHVAMRRGQLAQ